MKLNDVIRRLESLERKSEKEGYKGDAAEYAFRANVLKLVSKLVKQNKKRKPSAWNIFAGKMVKQGKTIQEAAKEWNKRKSKKPVRSNSYQNEKERK